MNDKKNKLIFLLLICYFLLADMHLSKERRYLLNSTMIREISRRERDHHKRMQLTKAATGVSGAELHIPTGKTTTMTFYSIGVNPFYHYWTMDKDRREWLPQKFDKDVANASLVDVRVFSKEFIDAMDALYSIMQQAKCITDREYEDTFKQVFSASYNIGRFYFDWEKTHFGVTKVCDKWHQLILNE